MPVRRGRAAHLAAPASLVIILFAPDIGLQAVEVIPDAFAFVVVQVAIALHAFDVMDEGVEFATQLLGFGARERTFFDAVVDAVAGFFDLHIDIAAPYRIGDTVTTAVIKVVIRIAVIGGAYRLRLRAGGQRQNEGG